jgi:hypothetical protein
MYLTLNKSPPLDLGNWNDVKNSGVTLKQEIKYLVDLGIFSWKFKKIVRNSLGVEFFSNSEF